MSTQIPEGAPPFRRVIRVTCMTTPTCPEHAVDKIVPLPDLGQGVAHDPGYTTGQFVCCHCDSGLPMDRGMPFFQAITYSTTPE